MSDLPPRHLTPRPRGGAVSRRRWLYAGGLVAVLAVGAAIAIGAIGGGDRGSTASPDFTVAPALAPSSSTAGTASTARPSTTTTPPTTAPPATTAPPPSAPRQPVQRTPGNLLANGDFESGLAGWDSVGHGLLDRVAVGHSGAWSARIRRDGKPPGVGASKLAAPGMLAAGAVPATLDGSYEASVWLRASRLGVQATLALRELGGAGEGSGDLIGVTLADAGWHQVAVIHQIQQAGTRLTVEVTATNLRPGDGLLVDQVSVTRS